MRSFTATGEDLAEKFHAVRAAYPANETVVVLVLVDEIL